MSITVFGSCRVFYVYNNNNLNHLINFTHSTKEVIQQIKFLMGELSLPYPLNILCFRTAIIDNEPIIYNSKFKKMYDESNYCIVEICSDKVYKYDTYYLHHLSVDPRFSGFHTNTPKQILDNHKCIKQPPSEIEDDIVAIKNLIAPKTLVLVTHYNSKINEEYIPSRNNLINLLTDISKKYNILIINPTEILKEFDQELLMTDDLAHYTSFGKTVFTRYLNEFMNQLHVSKN